MALDLLSFKKIALFPREAVGSQQIEQKAQVPYTPVLLSPPHLRLS